MAYHMFARLYSSEVLSIRGRPIGAAMAMVNVGTLGIDDRMYRDMVRNYHGLVEISSHIEFFL